MTLTVPGLPGLSGQTAELVMAIQTDPEKQETDRGLAEFDASPTNYSKITAAVEYATDRLPHVDGEAVLTLYLQYPIEHQAQQSTRVTIEKCGCLIRKADD